MKTYCITYDLNNSGKNYDGLIEAIKTYNYKKVLLSAWLVKSTSSANDIYKSLKPFIDNDDYLIVFEINLGNKQGWIPQSVWDWLN